jgi:hypothetical protein
MGAVVRCMIKGRPHWLTKMSDKPMDYGYLPDRTRAHIFPDRDSAQHTAFALDREHRQREDIEIVPV